MKDHIQTTKTYITTHKKKIAIGSLAALITLGIITAITLLVQNNAPKVIYQPTKACDLFNFSEARKHLGEDVITSTTQSPILSNNTATSKCGYTDGNPDMNGAIVAAIMVRSGVNDAGVQQNKAEFAAGKPTTNAEGVEDLGESAYFNTKLGQLNILDDKNWLILSYGVGSSPETNDLDKTTELAKEILH